MLVLKIMVLKKSFKIYCAINDGIIILIDKIWISFFFHTPHNINTRYPSIMVRKYSWIDLSKALKSLPKDKEKEFNQFLDEIKDDAETQLVLSRVLSKLEMLKEEGVKDQSGGKKRKKDQSEATKESENENIIGAVMRKLKSLDSVDVYCWSLLALGAGLIVMVFKASNNARAPRRDLIDEILTSIIFFV